MENLLRRTKGKAEKLEMLGVYEISMIVIGRSKMKIHWNWDQRT